MFFTQTYSTRHGRRGAILIFTVFLLSTLMVIASTAMVAYSNYQTRNRARYENYKDEFAAVERALNQTYGHVLFLSRHVGHSYLDTAISNSPQPGVPGYDILDFNITENTNTMTELDYTVEIRAKKNDANNKLNHLDHPGIRISQRFSVNFTPLNEYAIFYDPVMEIAPGPQMTINGKVHCNGDAYIQSQSGLTFQQNVTVAGNIYHGRHPDSGKSSDNGAVNFTGPDGTGEVNMRRNTGDSNGDHWLDSRDSDWADSRSAAEGGTGAYAEWGDSVKDSNMGVTPLELPIPTTADTHDIIERSDANDQPALKEAKFENKADIIIEQDSAGNVTVTKVLRNAQGEPTGGTQSIPPNYYIDASGDAVGYNDGDVLPLGVTTKTIVSKSTFYDEREQKYVDTLDVDIGNMVEYDDSVPDNGVLYVSTEDQGTNLGAVRLKNGKTLPDPSGATGFSVASDDPMYVQGDYNNPDDSTKKTVALVAGDSVSCLSNSWDDVNAATDQEPFGQRRATETTMNTVFINGVVPSGLNDIPGYSGGVENYFRFLEDWSGRNFNFSGSIISLWESEKATGLWKYGGPVYTAPKRPWSWDTLLGTIGPPGMPHVISVARSRWQVEESESN